MTRSMNIVLALTGIVALLVVGCGGGEGPTSTPVRPAPTAAPPSPIAAAPTVVPTPTPAAAAVPTPTLLSGKRGGTLTTRSFFQPNKWDTFDSFAEVHLLAPMLNNLVQVDPYGDGKTIVGDVAERWEFSDGAKVISFIIRKGIKFHDGTLLTAKDVAYNFDRGWKPRTPTMVYFRGRFSSIQNIETPDDFTVRVTLKEPSNAFFESVALSPFLMYPASFPFPDKLDDWKKNPVGTGPFRFKNLVTDSKLEFVRNEGYWKPGLPYLDGHDLIQLGTEGTVAGFRTGRLDATNLDTSAVTNVVDLLVKATGFVYKPINLGLMAATFNQRPPWTDPRAREAIDLALDRKTLVDAWLLGLGTPYASPMLPVDMGGRWGISTEEIRKRPGFRPERRQEDVARAKQLLAQAGIDPSQVTVNLIAHTAVKSGTEAAEPTFRELGFKTKLENMEVPQLTERSRNQEFSIYLPNTANINADDPMDIQADLFLTGGSFNYGKWSDPSLDALFLEQDKTLDVVKRRELLLKLQERMLDLRWSLAMAWRQAHMGAQPWMKNYPFNLPFLFSPRYRYEQAWLDR